MHLFKTTCLLPAPATKPKETSNSLAVNETLLSVFHFKYRMHNGIGAIVLFEVPDCSALTILLASFRALPIS